jgi:hypothetical protein
MVHDGSLNRFLVVTDVGIHELPQLFIASLGLIVFELRLNTEEFEKNLIESIPLEIGDD